jgi:hypothetical protein
VASRACGRGGQTSKAQRKGSAEGVCGGPGRLPRKRTRPCTSIPSFNPPQYFAFYDGGDRAGCYHRVTAGWPISRLDTTAIGGSWDAPTQALVMFQVRPAPRSRALLEQGLN